MSKEPHHIEKLPLYFDDLDALGMVYHAKFPILLDRAFCHYFDRLGLYLGHEDASVVVRELKLTFEKPIDAVPSVDVQIWVENIGTTSVTFLFHFSVGTVVHAQGRRANVKIDPMKGVPVPWSSEFRKKLAVTDSSLSAEVDGFTQW